MYKRISVASDLNQPSFFTKHNVSEDTFRIILSQLSFHCLCLCRHVSRSWLAFITSQHRLFPIFDSSHNLFPEQVQFTRLPDILSLARRSPEPSSLTTLSLNLDHFTRSLETSVDSLLTTLQKVFEEHPGLTSFSIKGEQSLGSQDFYLDSIADKFPKSLKSIEGPFSPDFFTDKNIVAMKEEVPLLNTLVVSNSKFDFIALKELQSSFQAQNISLLVFNPRVLYLALETFLDKATQDDATTIENIQAILALLSPDELSTIRFSSEDGKTDYTAKAFIQYKCPESTRCC